MNTPYILLFFGGPAIAAIAFVACLFPETRPQRLARTLGALGLVTSLPVALGILMNSGYPLLILRPGTIFLGLLAAISYFVLTRRFRFPPRQCVAAIALLLASVWDGVSLTIIMTPGFGGEYCQNLRRMTITKSTDESHGRPQSHGCWCGSLVRTVLKVNPRGMGREPVVKSAFANF